MEISREIIAQIVAEILAKSQGKIPDASWENRQKAGAVMKVRVPKIQVSEQDRMDTGKPGDIVYTHDLFSLSESKRLGCGIMEMVKTTFDWTLNYDEIDYVMEGSLTIRLKEGQVTAGPGEVILIPKGSQIQFCVPERARFLYVTYPADWAEQK